MAILGQIRSKSIFLIIVIGLALFAFVISGVFDGKGYQAQQPVGIINGEDILIEDFRGQVDFLKRNYNQKGMVAVNNVGNQRLISKILFKSLILLDWIWIRKRSFAIYFKK